jgi:hypothetical protein
MLGERFERRIPATLTYRELLREVGANHPQLDYAVTCDGTPVAEMDRVPAGGSLVTVRAVPMGGDEGEGKSILRIALAVAMIAAVSAIPGFNLAAASWVAKSLITTSALLVSNALVPMPGQEKQRTPLDAEYWRNCIRPYGAVPKIYGRIRTWPPLAAQVYTDVDTIYMLYVVGYGRLQITDVRVGDVPITYYLTERDSSHPNGGFEVREGSAGESARTIMPPEQIVTVYGGPLDDLSPNSDYNANETYITEVCDEIAVRFDFPVGLGALVYNVVDEKWHWRSIKATLRLRARPYGSTGAWTVLTYNEPPQPWMWAEQAGGQFKTKRFTANIRRQLSAVISQAYQIQVRRDSDSVALEPGDTQIHYRYQCVLQDITTVLWTDPIKQSNVATIGIKVTIDDNNREYLGDVQWDRVSCVAQSYLNRWTGSAWGVALTQSPAAVFRDILQGTANAHPVADARLDLPSIQAWSQWCGTDYTFNGEFKDQKTIWQALALVTAAGRATPQMINGKYGVWYDRPQTTVTQLITPRNSWGWSSTRRLPDLLHCIKAQYANRANQWQQVERWIYYGGYNIDGSDGKIAATNLESREFFGVDNDTQADNLAWYMMQVANLRLERATVNMDMENMVCVRGDLVRVAHDVPLHGQGWGRIKVITGTYPTIPTIQLDEQVYLHESLCKIYGRTARTSSPWYQTFLSPVITYSPPAAYTDTLNFPGGVNNWSGTNAPAVGDLVQFGLPAEEIGHDYLVAGIEPHEDMSATLDLIEYQSGVYGVTGEESYEPHVEDFPPDPKYMDPSSPRVSAIQTDEWALWYGPDGTIDPQILVSVSLWSGAYAPTAYWEAQIRSHIDGQGAENGWRTGGQFEGSSRSLGLRPVLQGHRYDFRLRTRSDHNRVSQWVLWDNSEEGYLVIGKATPPPDPVSMTRDGASVRWGYVMATAPPDMAGFEVRVHAGDNAGWDNAQKLHAGVLRAQSFPLSTFGWGVFTFYVKAVDTSGNYSTNAASIAINFGDPIVDNP